MSVKLKPVINESGEYDQNSILVARKYEMGKKLQIQEISFKSVNHKVLGGGFRVLEQIVMDDGQTYSKLVRDNLEKPEGLNLKMVEKGTPISQERKNHKKVILLVAFPILFLIVFSYLGWLWYSSTPSYALGQIKKSVENSNRLLFENYVEIDKFCENLVDEFMVAYTQKSMKDTDSDGWKKLGGILGQKLIESFKPTLTSSLSSAITRSVEKGSFEFLWEPEKVEDDKLEVNIFEKSNLGKESFSGLGEIVEEGNRSYIPLIFDFPLIDTTLSFKLDMRKGEENWQIVGVADFSHFLISIFELQQNKIDKYNRDIKDEIMTLARLEDFIVRNMVGLGEEILNIYI